MSKPLFAFYTMNIFFIVVFLVTSSAFAADKLRLPIEAYPDIIEKRLQSRKAEINALPEKFGEVQPKLIVIRDARRWKPGETITVAFEAKAGDPPLRRVVEEAAQIWTQYANIKFDFYHPKTREYSGVYEKGRSVFSAV